MPGGGGSLALRAAALGRAADSGDDDRALAQAAKHGDAHAFTVLFERYMPQVFRLSLARLGDPDDAEDVTSVTFAKLAHAIRRYDDRGVPFRAYLFRIARNALVDHVRARRDRVSLDAVADLPATGASHGDDPAALSDRIELLAALQHLPDLHREVLALRFIEGYDAAEVAAIVGRTVSAVRSIQHRALAQLRAILGAEGR